MLSPRILIAFVAAAGLSGCAVKRTEFSEPGWYAGAALIGALPNFDDVGGADLDEDELTEGIGLRAGWRFLDRFAVELGYETFADFEMDVVDVQIENLLLTGKFYPFTGSMQPYGLVGVGYQGSEIDDINFDESDPAGRIGLGFEWYLIDLLPLFIEIDQRIPTGDSDDLQYNTIQLGAMIRF
jgi:hypothetical protein